MTKDMGALYEEYFERLVMSAVRKGVPREEAEDMASDLFIRLMGEPPEDSNYSQFLFGHLKFVVMRWRREQKNRAEIREFDAFGNENNWDDAISAMATDVPLYTPQQLARREEYKQMKSDPERWQKHLASSKEWQKKHPEKLRGYWRAYYQRNKDWILAKDRMRQRVRKRSSKFLQLSGVNGQPIVMRRSTVDFLLNTLGRYVESVTIMRTLNLPRASKGD